MPGMRSAAILLIISLATSGCAIRGRGKPVAYAVDGVAVVAGGAIAISAGRHDCPKEPISGVACTGANLGLVGAGIAIAAAGIVGFVINGLINVHPGAATPASDATAGTGPAAPVPASHPNYHDRCDRWVSDWQAEQNEVAKAILYRDMDSRCRARVDRIKAGSRR